MWKLLAWEVCVYWLWELNCSCTLIKNIMSVEWNLWVVQQVKKIYIYIRDVTASLPLLSFSYTPALNIQPIRFYGIVFKIIYFFIHCFFFFFHWFINKYNMHGKKKKSALEFEFIDNVPLLVRLVRGQKVRQSNISISLEHRRMQSPKLL